jgi:hypothetical protein
MAIKLYKIKSDETVIDTIISTYCYLDGAYDFILLNNLDSIESILTPTDSLSYDTTLINFKPSQLYLGENIQATTKVVKTFDNQSIYDVCLQNYGSLDTMYEFITNNDFINVDDSDVQLKDVIIKRTLEVENYSLLPKKFATLNRVIEELNKYYILLENDFYLLFEDGFKIEQEN